MPGMFKVGVSTGSSNFICTRGRTKEVSCRVRTTQTGREILKSKQSNVHYLRLSVGTRVSYGQLGSDTKLCGTPIRGIELPHLYQSQEH